MKNHRPGKSGSEATRTTDVDLGLSVPTAVGSAYLVVVSPYGQPRRRPYLSLHHASNAPKRTQATGKPTQNVLCKMVPVATDLELDGEVTE
jgi:hypothetical protein